GERRLDRRRGLLDARVLALGVVVRGGHAARLRRQRRGRADRHEAGPRGGGGLRRGARDLLLVSRSRDVLLGRSLLDRGSFGGSGFGVRRQRRLDPVVDHLQARGGDVGVGRGRQGLLEDGREEVLGRALGLALLDGLGRQRLDRELHLAALIER